jgi:hypothetical protein
MNELEPFEFTKQEEISIDECICEISEVIWEFIASGIKGEVEKQVTIFDIISQIIGVERSKPFHFAITGVKEIDGKIVLQTNEGSIAKSSVIFLENLLQKQIKYFEENLPQALHLRTKARQFCLGTENDESSGIDIKDLPSQAS